MNSTMRMIGFVRDISYKLFIIQNEDDFHCIFRNDIIVLSSNWFVKIGICHMVGSFIYIRNVIDFQIKLLGLSRDPVTWLMLQLARLVL